MLIRKLVTGITCATMGTSSTTTAEAAATDKLVNKVAMSQRWSRWKWDRSSSKSSLFSHSSLIIVSLVLVVSVLVDLVQGDSSWEMCLPCSCKWTSGKKTADCTARNFYSVPTNLSNDLQVIDLSSNSIAEIRKNEILDANLQNMHKLFMRSCTLQQLHRDSFIGLKILIELDLSSNNIRELPVGLFRELDKIRTLVINKNQIERIDDRLFDNLKHLHKVELKENLIHTIGKDAFLNLPQLGQIYLDNNQLKSLRKDSFENLDKLTSLSIPQNPWNCTCDLEQFRDFIITRNLHLNPTCAEPSELRGKSWNDMSADNFACRPKIMRVKPSSKLRSANENETLECEIYASPKPEIYWLFNKKNLNNYDNRYKMRPIESYKKSGTDVFITKLTIIGMRASDKGTYTCVASNRGGKDEAHIVVERTAGGIFLSAAESDSSRPFLSNIYALIALILLIILIPVLVVVLVCYLCRKKRNCLGNNSKKYSKNSSMVSENGLLHSKLNEKQQNDSMIEGGSVIMEMQTSLLTEVNPVEKPPRRTDVDSNGTYNDIMDEKAEIKKTLLDETAFGSHDDETQSVALSDSAPRSRQTFVDDGYGTNLPPDLLAFSAGGGRNYGPGSLPPGAQFPPTSIHNSIQNLTGEHPSAGLYGTRSPLGSPIYGGSHGVPAMYNKPTNAGFRTLPHQKFGSGGRINPGNVSAGSVGGGGSRTQSPFTPGPIIYQPMLMKQQGYVTIPRRPRTPSWAPSIGSTGTNTTNLDSLPPNGGGQSDIHSPISPSGTSECSEPVYDNLGLRTTASGNSVLNLNKLGNQKYTMKDRPLPATPNQQQQVPGPVDPIYDYSTGQKVKKVPPIPPPKPKKKISVTSHNGTGSVSQLYQDEGEDGTEV